MWCVLLTSSFDPGITVTGSDDLVGKMLEIFLGGGVFESATDQTLGSEDCVFRVCDCLYI